MTEFEHFKGCSSLLLFMFNERVKVGKYILLYSWEMMQWQNSMIFQEFLNH